MFSIASLEADGFAGWLSLPEARASDTIPTSGPCRHLYSLRSSGLPDAKSGRSLQGERPVCLAAPKPDHPIPPLLPSLQKFARPDPKGFGDLGHDLNRRITCPPLDVTDVGSVYLRMVGERFLT